MNPMVAASLAQGGASVVSGVGQGIFGSLHAKRAHQRNMDAWREANLYNSPKEQMKRFQEAGLNPNLIYGKGSASAGNASLPHKKPVPATPNFSVGDPMQAVLAQSAMRKNYASIDLTAQHIKSQQLENLFKAGSLHGRIKHVGLKNALLGMQKTELEDRNNRENDLHMQRMAKLLADIQVANALFDGRELENELARLKLQYRRDGVELSDPWYFRQASKNKQTIGQFIQSQYKGIKFGLNNLFMPGQKFW